MRGMQPQKVCPTDRDTIIRRMFTKTFYRFFFAFVVIIGVAFGVLIITGLQSTPEPVDNLAVPQ